MVITSIVQEYSFNWLPNSDCQLNGYENQNINYKQFNIRVIVVNLYLIKEYHFHNFKYSLKQIKYEYFFEAGDVLKSVLIFFFYT